MLNIGDYVAQINKDSSGVWKLYKDKINKITTTKKYGRRYFTKTVFRPLDADDADNNTKDMEESIGKGYIITRAGVEIYGEFQNGMLIDDLSKGSTTKGGNCIVF